MESTAVPPSAELRDNYFRRNEIPIRLKGTSSHKSTGKSDSYIGQNVQINWWKRAVGTRDLRTRASAILARFATKAQDCLSSERAQTLVMKRTRRQRDRKAERGWVRRLVVEHRNRARLVIADDHTLLAEACKRLLEPEFDVVAIVNNGRALLQVAPPLKPDVAIVDIAMPQLNGLDAGEQLKHLTPSIRLVYMTMNLEPDVAAEAFRRGAAGYVLKNSAAEELVSAIRCVLKGESYLSPSITKDTVRFLLKGGKSNEEGEITPRQSEVLQLLAEGKSMKEIASVLHVKPGTIAFHKYKMMESLGLKTNAELLQYAIRHHIVPS